MGRGRIQVEEACSMNREEELWWMGVGCTPYLTAWAEAQWRHQWRHSGGTVEAQWRHSGGTVERKRHNGEEETQWRGGDTVERRRHNGEEETQWRGGDTTERRRHSGEK
jgi:hypothetical protein